MKRLVLLFFWMGSTLWCLGKEDVFKGVVVSILDGNTLEVKSDDNEVTKIMLYGVDSPEMGQAYGDEAKEFLEKTLLKKKVTVTVQGMDRWGNKLGIVVTEKYMDPRVELLKKGLAWTQEKNGIEEFEGYITWAKQKGIGLWKDKEPTPPWVYRRQQTMLRPKSSS